MQYSVVWVT